VEFEPKPISREGVPAALEKAERYRLLNEPVQAESICLDVLALESDNMRALVTLLLAITDQFPGEMSAGVRRAREVVGRLQDEYKRDYYNGIVCERYALAQLHGGAPRAGEAAYHGIRDAMAWYEKAIALHPAGEDEAILRWNTCARTLARNGALKPSVAEAYEPSFE
jgi:hypothetical protein